MTNIYYQWWWWRKYIIIIIINIIYTHTHRHTQQANEFFLFTRFTMIVNKISDTFYRQQQQENVNRFFYFLFETHYQWASNSGYYSGCLYRENLIKKMGNFILLYFHWWLCLHAVQWKQTIPVFLSFFHLLPFITFHSLIIIIWFLNGHTVSVFVCFVHPMMINENHHHQFE